MKHRATPRFWDCYRRLPADIQDLADKCYTLMLDNPRHPSLQFKKAGEYWSVRVGLHYRAIGIEEDGQLIWVWIGPHSEYDQLLRR